MTALRIRKLVLHTACVDAVAAFYRDIRGLPTDHASDSAFAIRAGRSELTFNAAPKSGGTPFYPFAFEIPGGKTQSGIEWLRAKKIGLHVRPDGRTTHYSPTWDATSILREMYKLERYKDSFADFAAVGDEHGRFNLSAIGRVWPGSNRPAEVHPVEVEIERDMQGVIAFDGLPYRIRGV